jgi:hypothetical protein
VTREFVPVPLAPGAAKAGAVSLSVR